MLNGQALLPKFRQSGLTGKVLIWNEMLCEGPVSYPVCSEEFCKQRAAFFTEHFPEVQKDYLQHVMLPLNDLFLLIEQEAELNEITLWFEYDLFCQLNLLAVLSLLFQLEIPQDQIRIISVSEKNGVAANFSDFETEELKELHETAFIISEEQFENYHSLWQLYCSHNHQLLLPFCDRHLSDGPLPARAAIKSHLARFPSAENGLNEIENSLLKMIARTPMAQEELWLHARKQLHHYGFGDVQFRWYLSKLKGLFKEEKSKLQLSKTGQALLSHERYWNHMPHYCWGRCSGDAYQYKGGELHLVP